MSNHRDWVKCPICGEDDMPREIETDDLDLPETQRRGYITCHNLNCASNGGTNSNQLDYERYKRRNLPVERPPAPAAESVVAELGKPLTSFHTPLKSGAHYFRIVIDQTISGRVSVNPSAGGIVAKRESKLGEALSHKLVRDKATLAIRANGAPWDSPKTYWWVGFE